MKYVLYPLGFLLGTALLFAFLVFTTAGFGLVWRWAFNLSNADAAAAGSFTLCACIVMLGGAMYAKDVA